MRRTLLRSKIHRATVTAADLHYEGSLSLDPLLMEAAAILPFEKISVYNITNGERFDTYAILGGAPGAGEIQVNGAAARLAAPGDQIIIACYSNFEEAEALQHEPRIILVDEANRPTRGSS